MHRLDDTPEPPQFVKAVLSFFYRIGKMQNLRISSMPVSPDSIQLSLQLPQEPRRVFAAWMDPREHAQFTGGGTATIEPWTGGRFTAFEGDVHGIFLGVDAGARIVQTFRTPDFARETRDSRVTVTFEPSQGGTLLKITHSDVPPSLLRKLQRGWESSYIKALPKHLAKTVRQRKADAAAAEAGSDEEKPAPAAVATPIRAKREKPKAKAKAAAKPAKGIKRRPAKRPASAAKNAKKKNAKKAKKKKR
jgi:uncharacterized protein YndB with AHSA1/START domain